MQKNIIILIGGQGSGKGTQAANLLIQKKYNYIETGAMLRALPPESEIAQIISRGELLSDEKIESLVQENFADSKEILLDGFPRTLPQAQWLLNFARDKFAITVIYLNLPESVMIERIAKRRALGGGRPDDADAAAVRKRLDNFWKKTIPAIEMFRNAPNVKFLDVDATRTVTEIADDIQEKLG